MLPALAFAQGTLDPSGAPAASMKSLDQIEARIPIGKVGGSTDQIVINKPGSYVLLGDLTATAVDPIRILSGDVTIDLNGFTVTAQDGTTGIDGSAFNGVSGDIVIRNGRIVSTTTYDGKAFTTKGAYYGIVISTYDGTCTISDVTVRGMRSGGILITSLSLHSSLSALSPSTTVRRCTVSICAGQGIFAGTITDSTAETCGMAALTATTVTNSVGISVATGSGIRANTVTNSYGQSKIAFGVVANNEAPYLGTATNCRGLSATGTGLFAAAATNCVGISTSGTGLSTVSTNDALDTGAAENCLGTSESGVGLQTGTATNCTGRSATSHGLQANLATNSRGLTTDKSKIGIWVSGTATGCRGTNTGATGTGPQNAISCTIAVACTADSGTINAGTRNLGTP
jgi:hypothetical protein